MKQRSAESSKMKASLAPKNVALLSMIFLVFSAATIVVDSAEAAPNRRVVNGTQLSNTTYVYEYDASGRLSAEHGTTYHPDGHVLSHTDRVYTRDRDGRMLETIWERSGANEVLLNSQRAVYVYDKGRLAELHRTLINYVTDDYRTEEVRFHVFHKGKGRVQETRVYGRDRTLEELRYVATDHNQAGKTTSRDYSIYDPYEVQIRRHLETFQYNRDGVLGSRARMFFDENDEVVRSEQAVVHFDGRVDKTTAWTLFDADEEITGYRDVRVESYAQNRRPRRITTTLFGRDGEAIQRRIETTTFTEQGRMIAKRASVEYFD